MEIAIYSEAFHFHHSPTYSTLYPQIPIDPSDSVIFIRLPHAASILRFDLALIFGHLALPPTLFPPSH